ncbi:MAG: hypothetical protein D3923_06025, partial [Candidatus Electrothrix sp. AR3]|nr:hypothetical protein [Candidatus Electrothrix sp. AR3]
ANGAVFVDQSKKSLQLIHANISSCFAAAQVSLLRLDLSRADRISQLKNKLPAEICFDLIFIDPPYEKKLAATTLKMVEESSLINDEGLAIVEERKNANLPQQSGSLELIDQRTYGETGLWIYRKNEKLSPILST